MAFRRKPVVFEAIVEGKLMKFRKKPVVIEAVVCGEVLDDVSKSLKNSPDWIVKGFNEAKIGFELDAIVIKTLEGEMRAARDDVIIQGVRGELYPCKPDIFAATYEKVE